MAAPDQETGRQIHVRLAGPTIRKPALSSAGNGAVVHLGITIDPDRDSRPSSGVEKKSGLFYPDFP